MITKPCRQHKKSNTETVEFQKVRKGQKKIFQNVIILDHRRMRKESKLDMNSKIQENQRPEELSLILTTKENVLKIFQNVFS